MPIELEELKAIRILAKDWLEDIAKGKKGESIVYQTLIQHGYTIVPFILKEKEEIILTKEEKIERAREEKFVPDALAFKNGEAWFIDVKTKSKRKYLGWVNVRDYHKYWNFMKYLKTPAFIIVFYIEETKEIWFHFLRNPNIETFPIEFQPDGEVYTIPQKELKLFTRIEGSHEQA
jgi:hypothetical protein